MAVSEAQRKAEIRWRKQYYDQIGLFFRKDAEINKAFIKQYAASRGESVNGLLKRALFEMVERDKDL